MSDSNHSLEQDSGGPTTRASDTIMHRLAHVTNCAELIVEAGAINGNADAVILPDDRITYVELLAGARRWAHDLIALGVGKGEHVGILLPNSNNYMQALFGVMLVGAAPVPINVRYRGQEIAALAADARLTTIILTNEEGQFVNFTDRINEAFQGLAKAENPFRLSLAETPHLRHIIVAEGDAPKGFIRRDDVADIAVGADEIDRRWRSLAPEDTALILYTSGSTSRPKGCLLSHRALLNQGRLMAGRYKMTARDRIWAPLPMFHVGGISPMIAIALAGGAFLSMPRMEPGPSLAMMANERATISYVLFQTIIADLLQHPDFGKYDFSAVRLMISNPSMQPPWICDLLAERLPGAIQIGTFGMTETVGAACTHSPDDAADDRLHRLGRPLPGVEVRIVDESGEDVATGAIGQVLLRGPSLFSGYYNDAEKTASAMLGGWFHTGDRGSLSAGGSIMFHGRCKDVLKVGGENVGALEVETVIGMHPVTAT